MNYLLLHPDSWSPAPLEPALQNARVEARSIRGPADLIPDERPTVFLLPQDGRNTFPLDALRTFVDARGAIVALGAEGEDDVPECLPTELLSGFVPHPGGVRQLLVALRAAYREAAARAEAGRARSEALLRGNEVTELAAIGAKLMTERDPKQLLDDILTQARRLTQSDAGSLYLVETVQRDESDGGESSSPGEAGEEDPADEKHLRFRLAQNSTLPYVPLVEFTIPIDRTSLAGYAAVTGEPLVINDAYLLPPDVEYTFNGSFDQRHGYRSRSMLIIPMKDHKGEIIGVLQLINRKRDPNARLATLTDVDREVILYSRRTIDLVTALAGQAAVSIENSRLYAQIEKMFEGFVNAAVQAIEQRDPVTQGHSRRVATLTVSLAKTVDQTDRGRYGDTRFTREQINEIKYAGLLHDFGKVGVREHVLTKAKKLYPGQLELIKQRHAFVQRTLQRDFWRKRAEFLEQQGAGGYQEFVARLDEDHRRELQQLDHFIAVVLQANEPSLLASESAADLAELGRRTYQDLSGQEQPLLTEQEMRYLTIRKGSLDDVEREQIESHVTQTYVFLQEIPWTNELIKIPEIAYGHHELMNGTGYPRRIAGPEIKVQTRMMTISDIYDALTAQDRPYKKAVPAPKALDIMDRELVRSGQLDADLFQLFVEAKVYRETTPD
ncbi:MAG TPA: HD domain-containing phosphohydrolase [Gemmatimonadales bacterium]|nr:HD domain-containing phosphohydrolase [Gemmatimonadales bacterium]